MTKKILIALPLALLVIVGGLFFSKYQSSNGAGSSQQKQNFSSYILAYTWSHISVESTIRIVLANPTQAEVEIGVPVKERLFEFAPSIEGEAVWLDSKTIEFKPKYKLEPDKLYRASFYLSKVLDVPSEYERFDFTFNTLKQSFSVDVQNVTSVEREGDLSYEVSGALDFADVVDSGLVERILTAKLDEVNMPIYFLRKGTKEFQFIVKDIKPADVAKQLVISWTGADYNIDGSGTKEITIPCFSCLELMNLKVVNEPEQYISLQFSKAILPDQELSGLVTLTNATNLKFSVDNNEVKVFPSAPLIGEQTLQLNVGIASVGGLKLLKQYTYSVVFEDIKPQVSFVGKGTILPTTNGMYMPFNAVNLKAVDVKVIKIYENNILQFLQVNTLDGNNELYRVGKTILKKTIPLSYKSAKDLKQWQLYHLDLTSLIKIEPGAIYKVYLDFKKEYSLYNCGSVNNTTVEDLSLKTVEDDIEDEEAEYTYYSDYGDEGYYEYDEEYDYSLRGDPCSKEYYRFKSAVSRSILASDIGIIAKKSEDGSINVALTDLKTIDPLIGCAIELYDFQQQLIGKAVTNEQGFATIFSTKKPFAVVAKNGTQRGYLKLEDGASLSMSMFDVSGEQVDRGMKGFVYTERGIWRPGDSIFLGFVLENKVNELPSNYPVTLELINPRGQQIKRLVNSEPVNGFYKFAFSTSKDAPTGNYTANIAAGKAVFTKSLKVETIMPNRLKINVKFEKELISASKENDAHLKVNWLHGAPAKNLTTKIDAYYSPNENYFSDTYKGFAFTNPTSNFYSESELVYEGKTDADGEAIVMPDFSANTSAPGILNSHFTVRVFEEGGAFSIDKFTAPFSPYTHYVGVKIPQTTNYSQTLVTDTNHVIDIVSVSENKIPISRDLSISMYKLNWRWWWNSYEGELANFADKTYNQLYLSKKITTTPNGKSTLTVNIPKNDWGRYLLLVQDEKSGHVSGKIIYFDWPSWYGRTDKGTEGATMLAFTSDKEKYNVNDDVTLNIPSTEKGRALLSIETGSKIIKQEWIQTTKGTTRYTFKATEEMAPNIYAFVSLVQPHAQLNNDLPIRMYGVLPIEVHNPETHLSPLLETIDVWTPEAKTSITISEKDGKDMAYTLAVVDEGLLDLTRFKTPDPWNYFYAREALGVKTWDLYDMVIGSYGAAVERLLAIGGDDAINKKGSSKANRFKPMVKYIGPFYLKKGEKRKHEFMLPPYVGSVRIMAIAGKDGAYGNAEKTVPVRKPLMLLATLPRVLGPEEEVDLPVTIFAMDKKVKNVSVKITLSKEFSAVDNVSKAIVFNEVGDKVINFKLKVKPGIGVGKVAVVAQSGTEIAKQEIEIDIRNPNQPTSEIIEAIIEPQKSWTKDFQLVGMPGTNSSMLEVSSIPPINLQERLSYLVSYPHGCIEQTTSSAFPQLYLSGLVELTDNLKNQIDRNIAASIERIKLFQTSAGGFAYWPGETLSDDWGTSYAGHYLLEAKSKGYTVSKHMLENWKKFQQQTALNWSDRATSDYYYHNTDLAQAYRLYTLALAQSPELSAMNRLKEKMNLSISAKWTLAAAYALIGQRETASKLITQLTTSVAPYAYADYTYGSALRDESIIVEALLLTGQKVKAADVVKRISGSLNSKEWYSTQTTAFGLYAISKYYLGEALSKGNLTCSYSLNGGATRSATTIKSIYQDKLVIRESANQKLQFKNTTSAVLFVKLINTGIPNVGKAIDVNNNLNMTIKYTSMDGKSIDVSSLEQGTDFIAEVSVTNPGLKEAYRNLALNQVFPSGWEILNTRAFDLPTTVKSAIPTYQDIRDDRVYTYFELNKNETKTFRVVLNAAYTGKFYLPNTNAEAMYDKSISNTKPGRWVVVKSAAPNS
ncbi:MAG: hypothetical protein J0M08_07125 [Bacteroidetes bacterium]|nr:hypothetical protein [Bacteroidota bacterium]